MVRRVVSFIVSLILIMSFTPGFAEIHFGPTYRPQSKLNDVYIKEPVYSQQFETLALFLSDIEEQFGYRPDADIDFDRKIVTIWLYNSTVEVECLICDENDPVKRRVIIPDFYFDEDLVKYNELYSTIPNEREYDIFELEGSNFKVDSVNIRDGVLKLCMYSKADNKDIDLKGFEFRTENGVIYVSSKEFRQLWYEVYKQDESRD